MADKTAKKLEQERLDKDRSQKLWEGAVTAGENGGRLIGKGIAAALFVGFEASRLTLTYSYRGAKYLVNEAVRARGSAPPSTNKTTTTTTTSTTTVKAKK